MDRIPDVDRFIEKLEWSICLLEPFTVTRMHRFLCARIR